MTNTARRPRALYEASVATVTFFAAAGGRASAGWLIVSLHGAMSAPDREKNKIARAEKPPGASRFSTLFYVAAIGGK